MLQWRAGGAVGRLWAWGVAILIAGCGRGGEPEQAATRRLTGEEWQNTVRDLLGVEVDRALLPVDELTAGYPNNVAGSLSEFDVENYLAAAELAAQMATQDVEGLTGCEPGRDCAAAWAPGFLTHAYRRPATDQEVAELLELYDAASNHGDGVRLMVTGGLVSGSFLYRPEIRGQSVSRGRVKLDDYEIASRLSYLLWRSMPDEALFDAAAEGKLSKRRHVEKQARRMLADPKAGRGVASFHLDWLGLANADLIDRLPAPDDAQEIQRLRLSDLPLDEWSDGEALSERDHRNDPGYVAEPDDEVRAQHGADLGTSFLVRGRLMSDTQGSEVGVEVLLGDPGVAAHHYRLFRNPDGHMELASIGDAAEACRDVTEFRVADEEWFEFEIEGQIRNGENQLQVSLWPSGEPPNPRPALTCEDTTASRPTRGTVGLWARGGGEASWANLILQTLRVVPFDFSPFAEAYVAETRGFIAEWLNEGGSFAELLTADWTMANEPIASVYGIDGVSGSELQRVTLPSERRGLLTQPLFLSTFAKPDQSSPVLRGMTVRSALLCEVLLPPPPDVAVIAPDPAPNATTRERFAEHTSDAGCAACHSLMDPIGFGFETFDQLGAFRSAEAGQPVDASGEIRGGGDAEGAFSDTRGLVDRLAQSQTVRECMVRQWYRYSVAHLEDPDAEDPALTKALKKCRKDDCVLEDVVVELVTGDTFRFRAEHDGDRP